MKRSEFLKKAVLGLTVAAAPALLLAVPKGKAQTPVTATDINDSWIAANLWYAERQMAERRKVATSSAASIPTKKPEDYGLPIDAVLVKSWSNPMKDVEVMVWWHPYFRVVAEGMELEFVAYEKANGDVLIVKPEFWLWHP